MPSSDTPSPSSSSSSSSVASASHEDAKSTTTTRARKRGGSLGSAIGSKDPRGKGRSSVHPAVINLRLILVSGKTKDFQFSPTESAGDIAQFVFDNWPQDWTEESVSSAEILRLIYQGRFLHGNVTLAALGLPTGKTTVMHLVPRESLPEPNSQDEEKKKKSRSSGCCASCCLL